MVQHAMNPISEQELREYRQQANWTMRRQMEENRKEFGLDAFPRFDWSPWRGELVFSSGGVPKVAARIQVAGSLSKKAGTWCWGWADAGLPAAVRQAALRVRRFGEERTVLTLMQARWAAKESDAWDMTALANRMIDGKGAFKCPGADGATFLVFTELRALSDRRRVFGARTCSHVLEEGRPILLVSREPDGEVLAVCGGEDDSPETARDLPLEKLLGLDPSLSDLADLPDGWAALRESPDQDWLRSKSE
jgi:hypothetical protein